MSESKSRTERLEKSASPAQPPRPSRWQVVERVALLVGLAAAVAGVVGLWFAVVAVQQSNTQMSMSEEQWTAGGANVELTSSLMSPETYVSMDPPSVTTTRSFVSYLVTNTGRLQVDIAGAQRADLSGEPFGEFACGEFPLTLEPGATEILVFADQGNVLRLGGVGITFASGDHKFLSGDPLTGPDADVLRSAYEDEINRAQAWCPEFEAAP